MSQIHSKKSELRLGVIIPVKNRRDLVIATLVSIKRQSVNPWRVIVIDDGSTDGSAQAVEDWLAAEQPKWEAVVFRQKPSGVSAARNQGARMANGADLLAFLDSDDQWSEDFVERALAAFDANPLLVAATADRIDVVHNIKAITETLIPWPCGTAMATGVLCKRILICCSASVFQANAFNRSGGFPQGQNYGEDQILALKISTMGPWSRIDSRPIKRHLFLSSGNETTTHLSSILEANQLQNYAELLEKVALEYGCFDDIRSLVSGRWRRAAKAMHAQGRINEATTCYKHALLCNPWNFKAHLEKFTISIGILIFPKTGS
jgi:glycosyltransferase involved in cell wall biosynthesis